MKVRRKPPSGPWGDRIERLIRRYRWSDRQACIAFGFRPSIRAGGGKELRKNTGIAGPVNRIRTGGPATVAFVLRLNELEKQLERDIADPIAALARLIRRNRPGDLAGLGETGAVCTETRTGTPETRIRRVVVVGKTGRVLGEETAEAWLGKYQAERRRQAGVDSTIQKHGGQSS